MTNKKPRSERERERVVIVKIYACVKVRGGSRGKKRRLNLAGSRELIKKKVINKNKFSCFLTCNLLLGTRNRRTDIAFCNQILSVQVEYSPESQS